ncbi:MAG: hypothetical protein IT435_08970 [Phycisphaerales bacterium]|nr:hypothetical protein [Phycisphaerales bacterium]
MKQLPSTVASMPRIAQVELEKLEQDGTLVGMMLDDAGKLLGYPWTPNMQDGTYSAYVEHLGGPEKIFIVKVWVDSQGRIERAIVKYD